MNRLVGIVLVWAGTSTLCGEPGERVPPGVVHEGDYAFAEVVLATTGHEVIAFDPGKTEHAALLERLQRAARAAVKQARHEGIRRGRANEVGNAMEVFVMEAMQAEMLHVGRPRNAAGRTVAAGYPDLEVDGLVPCYVELKTHSPATADSSQRTFYYSPSVEPKVSRDALHLLLAFQMVSAEEEGETVWRPERFRITSLEKLTVRLKLEYNQSNRGLYSEEHLLADEKVDTAPESDDRL